MSSSVRSVLCAVSEERAGSVACIHASAVSPVDAGGIGFPPCSALKSAESSMNSVSSVSSPSGANGTAESDKKFLVSLFWSWQSLDSSNLSHSAVRQCSDDCIARNATSKLNSFAPMLALIPLFLEVRSVTVAPY